MTVDLEELKRLAKAATPGPWQVSLNGSGEDGWVEDSNSQYLTTGYEGEMAAKDVRFIAAANPAAVLALIERVEELTGANIVNRNAIRLQREAREVAEARVSKLEAALRSITDESLAFDLDECRAAAAAALEAK